MSTFTTISNITITSKEEFVELCKKVAGVTPSDVIYSPSVVDELIDLSEEWIPDFSEWENLSLDLGWA